jgi:rubrerythrin
MNREQVRELLYQALETEMGGIQVYETAIECAVNEDLKEEWEEYLEQTKEHAQRMREVLESVGLDPETETPGRTVVRHIGESLVQAMNMARKEGEPGAAELVAAECIVHAETKDHMNWELIGDIVNNSDGEDLGVMRNAHKEVEDEEDEHLYHTMGWTRELWIKTLGLPAVIPPPEEKQDVKTLMEAARAKESRGREGGSRTAQAKAARSSKHRRPGASSKKSSNRKSARKKPSGRG